MIKIKDGVVKFLKQFAIVVTVMFFVSGVIQPASLSYGGV